MSLWCECKSCGGNDDAAFCENAMMDAWVAAHKADNKLMWLKVIGFIGIVIAIAAFFLPTGQ